MGFSSQDDMINKITGSGKFYRADINKIVGAAAYTAGRWYDMSGLAGTPNAVVYGDHVINGRSPANIANWTPNGTNWVVAASVFAKTSGTATTLTADSLNFTPVSGRFYRVEYTISAYASGTCTVSFGGAAGTARSANGTFVEVLTASSTAGLVFTASVSTAVFSINNISVVEWGASSGTITPASQILSDTTVPGAIYHGGNVSPDTKHILNVSAYTGFAAAVPSTIMFVDLLMVYPFIDANSASLQNLTNNQTLPRYTSGEGVRAFIVAANTVGAVAHNFSMTYTNAASTSGRQLPVTVSGTASAITPHITHAGAAANNYGPFLPLAAGDTGIKSVQSIQLSAGSGTASTYYHLVLCKPLTTLPLTTAGIAAERDLVNQLPSMPRIYDGACLGMLHFAGGATPISASFFGSIEMGWG